MQIEIQGVKVTLTPTQLKEIENQVKKNRPVTERIQTLQDVYNELSIDNSFLPYKYPSTKEEKSINAQAILFKIVQVYNEGTELDWKDTNQYKYLPYKYYSDGRWVVGNDGWNNNINDPVELYFFQFFLFILSYC